ncbi:MAG: arsenate reductase [Bacteroidia bacterium]
MKIYHNARCSKSREAYSLLADAGKDVEVIDYLKNPLTESELIELVELLGIAPFDLIRKKEAIFIKNYAGKDPKRVNWIKAMVKYPILMERPIVVTGDKAVIGRPPSLVLDI